MRQLFEDPLATIFFLVVYILSGDLFIAIGIAIAAGLVQIATRDGPFTMIKPSIVLLDRRDMQ
jgi:hypothetical protein